MTDMPTLFMIFFAGLLLGGFFFGGLWWTVRKGMKSENPAIWFFGSLLLRTTLILAAFYFLSQHEWSRLFACVVGFMIARIIVVQRLTRVPEANLTSTETEAVLRISPDELVIWKYGFVVLNSTIVTTWGLMLVLVVGSILVTRRIKTEGAISRWQGFMEIVVTSIQKQINDVGLTHPEKFVGFIGTLFLFIAFANLCTILPYYDPPTGSLSTTIALAACVFVAVPLYGIAAQGFFGYLKTYVEPTPIMLPFNIITQLSRTMALAVRLFGNAMSATMIIGILLTITPLFFPIFMNLLGLLTGMVQAYIFSILATVYIAAATRSGEV